MNATAVKKPVKLSVSEELDSIEKRDGKLSVKAVLRYARRVDSALHKQFEWNNSAAAELYRREQAKGIIRARVEYIPSPERETKMIAVRKYVSLTSERGSDGVYRNIIAVLKKPSLRKQMLEDALGEMRSFRNKYANFTELAKVHKEIDKVLK